MASLLKVSMSYLLQYVPVFLKERHFSGFGFFVVWPNLIGALHKLGGMQDKPTDHECAA